MGEQRKNDRELTQRYLDKLPEADKKALESERKASRDKQQSAIRAVLTPEQQKTFDTETAHMGGHRWHRGGPDGHHGQAPAKS